MLDEITHYYDMEHIHNVMYTISSSQGSAPQWLNLGGSAWADSGRDSPRSCER